MEDTLDTPMNQSVQSGLENKAVKTYLKMIMSNYSDKSVQIAEDKAIEDLLESNFDISNPKGTQKLNSQRLYQALWRVASKMKPLDFMIHGTGRQPYHEKIVTAGVSTVMDRGGYDSALRDKNGVFYNLLTVGDGPVMIGMNTNKKSLAPILFTPFSRTRLYLDNFCSGLRNRGTAGSAFRAVAIFSYSWEQVCDMYPEMKTKGGPGKIPTAENDLDDPNRTENQDINMEDETEIAFGYNIIDGKENFTVFVGSACTVAEEYNGKDYPYDKDGDPYIPILQFIGVPKKKGPFNYGIGHLLYKLALVSSRMLNMELGHAEDNTYPITLINTPQSEAEGFFQKLAVADKMRAAGKKPFVSLEYDPNDPAAGKVQAQSLLTNNLTNEWKLIYDLLIQEIQMLGINLKELTMEGNPTATEILSDEENSNSWVKQVMEYNASETQEAVEITMDAIKQFVPKTSKIPLNLTEMVTYDRTEVRADNVNLGLVSTELKDYNYFVKVNSRSGAIPSNTMLRAKVMQIMPYLAPGSQAFKKGAKELIGLNDLDISLEEMQATQQGGAQTPPEGGAPVSETDRLTFNPRTADQAAVL